MASDNLKDLVASSVNRAIEDAFANEGWTNDSLNAKVSLTTPSEVMVTIRVVNLIAGASEVGHRYFRVKVAEVK